MTTTDHVNRLQAILTFDGQLKVGDRVTAAFTNCGRHYRFPATIVKLNLKTARVVPDTPVYPGETADREFVIARAADLTGRWTWSNGLFPLEPVP